jgi:hypothetical protein
MRVVNGLTSELPLEDHEENLKEALSWAESDQIFREQSEEARTVESLTHKMDRAGPILRVTPNDIVVSEKTLIFCRGVARGAHEDDREGEAKAALEAIRGVIPSGE